MLVAQTQQICTFSVGGRLFGIDVTRVQEVIRHQEMTRVPLAPESIQGLINLRGQIVTAIDMRARLGVEPRVSGELALNVVVRSNDGPVSLLVDEIGDVVIVDRSSFEPLPETLNASSRQLLIGVYKLPGQLLLLLDPQRAAEPSEHSTQGS